MYGLVVQVDFCQVVQVVAQLGLDDIVCQHRVEHRRSQFHAIARQDVQVELQVLPDLQYFFVFEEGTENFKHFAHRFGFT